MPTPLAAEQWGVEIPSVSFDPAQVVSVVQPTHRLLLQTLLAPVQSLSTAHATHVFVSSEQTLALAAAPPSRAQFALVTQATQYEADGLQYGVCRPQSPSPEQAATQMFLLVLQVRCPPSVVAHCPAERQATQTLVVVLQ